MRTELARKLSRVRILRLLTYVNLVLVILLISLETFIAERHPFSTFVTLMPQAPFAVPVLVLIAVTVRRRDMRMLAINALTGLLLLVLPLGFRVPLRFGRAHSSIPVRVMTYNLHQGSHGADRVAAAIEQYSPDVLCVQEVNAHGPYGDPVWQLEQLQWKRWHVVRDGELAIMSRFPVRSYRLTYLPMGTMRAVLAAEISVGGRAVTVLNTHFNVARAGPSFLSSLGRSREYLASAASVRIAQTSALLDFARRFTGPVVIAGDLNTPPRGLCYRRITSHYTDCFAAAGWGFGYTYRPRVPVLRIDYVFAGPGLSVARCLTPHESASDHRPVVADLLIL